MDVVAKYGTTIVVLINTIFGLLGLVFLVGGCFVKLGSETLDKLAQGLLTKVADKIPPETGIDLKEFSISQFIGGAATAFIALGVVLLCLVVWAYCGTCCQSRWMLIVYAAILTIIILGEVVVVVLFTTNRKMIDDAIKEPLRETITKYYKGDTGNDGVSLGWNALMGLLNCCGVDGSDDFNSAASWTKTYTVTPSTGALTYTLDAPHMCCKDKSVPTCSVHSSSAAVHTYNQGCYAAIWDMIDKNKSIAIGVGAGVGVFELILWFLVVWIVKSLGKGKGKVSPSEDSR